MGSSDVASFTSWASFVHLIDLFTLSIYSISKLFYFLCVCVLGQGIPDVAVILIGYSCASTSVMPIDPSGRRKDEAGWY